MNVTEDQGPPPEVVTRVLDAFLIIDPEELLVQLGTLEPQSPLPASFVKDALDGLRSVTSAGSLPFQLVSHSVHQRRFDQIHTAERIRSLKDVERGQEPSGDLNHLSFQTANDRMSEFVRSDKGVKHFRDGILFDLDQRLSSPAVADAASELLVQTLISAWAVFESLVRAFVIAWINADPNRARSVLASAELKPYFGKQVVDIAVIGDHAFDLTTSMGDILFRDRRLDHLGVIRNVLDALFNDPDVRDALADDMWMLNQRRHLFVHQRGLVDAEYLGRTGDSVPLGKRLSVTSGDVEHYIRAVQSAFVAIASAADGVR